MAITLNGTSGITSPTYGGTVTAEYSVPVTAFKNRIINGAMMIDQRNAGASVTVPSGTQTFGVDRWAGYCNLSSKFSMQQNAGSITPPAGFKTYWGITSLAATASSSGDYFIVQQNIEGFNTTDLGFGAAGAATVTLSFWVRSSLTGTFAGRFMNSADNRSYVFTYSISSANTWEYKTVTIAGDTSGTWIGATNGTGLKVTFDLGSGSSSQTTAGSWQNGAYSTVSGATSVVGTNGATFYITGVQLEKGSTATSFDYRPYGTELALCQRYYYSSYAPGTAVGTAGATTSQISFNGGPTTYSYVMITCTLPVSMRATPTLTPYSPATGASGKIRNLDTSTDISTSGGGGINTALFTVSNVSIAGNSSLSLHYTSNAEL